MLPRLSSDDEELGMSSPQWLALRDALGETAGRFARLLETVRHPAAPAVGSWSIGDVAAHVHEVSIVNSWFVTGDQPSADLREMYDMATTVSVDRVRDLNALALRLLDERSPRALAPRIERQVAALLDAAAEADEGEQIAWLGGVKVPVKAVLGHMLSELFVHGNDVARAEGCSFSMPASHATLIFETFMIELLRSPDAARFAGDRADSPKPVTCELRLSGAEPVVLVAGSDGLAVRAPGERPVDARISADPAVMWLVMSNRISPLRAVLTRGMIVSGARPWRLRRLGQLLRTP
jgi:uncharacterized protein (TIGR03083 family)